TDTYYMYCQIPRNQISVDKYIDRVLLMLSTIDKALSTRAAWMFDAKRINTKERVYELIKDNLDKDGSISDIGASILIYKIMRGETASLSLSAGGSSEWLRSNLTMDFPGKNSESAFYDVDFSKKLMAQMIEIWRLTYATIGRSSLSTAIDDDYRRPPTAGWITYITSEVSTKCACDKSDYPVDVESVEPFGDEGARIVASKDPIQPVKDEEYDKATVARMRKLTSFIFDKQE
ncbi:MAG: hypothetical protein AAGC72_12625, partial [Planctomycetota bacterium]